MILTINSGTLSKAHESDAGYDIYASTSCIISPGRSEHISTNLKIILPPSTVAFVKPRSGLSFKFNIETGAGVIDQGYTGEIKVHLYNHGSEPYKVNVNDKIAQLVIIPIVNPTVLALNQAIYNKPSPSTQRKTNGFNSSGK